MKPKVLFLHSAGSQRAPNGSSGLVAQLRKALGGRYVLLTPRMPAPEQPRYAPWRDRLTAALDPVEGPVLLIGHSLGGSVLVKYLAAARTMPEVTALFLIAAPYWGKQGWGGEDFRLPPGFGRRLKRGAGVFLYHSRDDDIVPVRHVRLYGKALPKAKTRIVAGADHVFAQGIPQLMEDLAVLTGSQGARTVKRSIKKSKA